jgi:hypothetical protein
MSVKAKKWDRIKELSAQIEGMRNELAGIAAESERLNLVIEMNEDLLQQAGD